jgi:chromosome segregation ATPase
MVQLLLFILILLLPASSEAVYKIYLKNGSVLSEVDSYEKKGGEVTIYFREGSISIPENDIQKIEESESSAEELRSKETTEIKQKPAEVAPAPKVPVDDKSARVNALRVKLDAVYAEFRAVEKQEARLVSEINEIRGRRFTYNYFQLKQMEKETEPLQKELFTVQQKKEELRQKKTSLENELRALE